MKEGDNIGYNYDCSMNFPPENELLPEEMFKQVNTLHIHNICPYYMVSTHGRIWSKLTKRFLRPAYDQDGYAKCTLTLNDGSTKTLFVHRLMLMVFDPQMGYQDLVCNHIDGNKQNNYMGNLEWCTIAYNTQHAYDHGLEKRGEDHSAAKITDEMARQIIYLLPKVGDPPDKPVYSYSEIATMVGGNTTEKMVSDIDHKVSWRHMTENIEFTHIHKKPLSLYSDEDIYKICEYFETHSHENITMKAYYENALKYAGKEPNERLMDSVRKIYSKKYYSNITANRNFL